MFNIIGPLTCSFMHFLIFQYLWVRCYFIQRFEALLGERICFASLGKFHSHANLWHNVSIEIFCLDTCGLWTTPVFLIDFWAMSTGLLPTTVIIVRTTTRITRESSHWTNTSNNWWKHYDSYDQCFSRHENNIFQWKIHIDHRVVLTKGYSPSRSILG